MHGLDPKGDDSSDPEPPEALFERVYDELRSLADGYLNSERADHTLQPTALVHEAYLRLSTREETESPAWNDETHFYATAARAMHRVLVDHARGKQRAKRGGAWKRVDLDARIAWEDKEFVDLEALDTALEELEQLSPRQARVVELRFFGALPIPAIADVLDVSEMTVTRDWRFARAWLERALASS